MNFSGRRKVLKYNLSLKAYYCDKVNYIIRRRRT